MVPKTSLCQTLTSVELSIYTEDSYDDIKITNSREALVLLTNPFHIVSEFKKGQVSFEGQSRIKMINTYLRPKDVWRYYISNKQN